MKTINKDLRTIALLLVALVSYGQDVEKSNLRYRSWSVTPIEVYDFSSGNQDLFSGVLPFSISTDLAFSLNESLFSISATYGEESGIFSGSANFKQISLLYGREFELNEWLFFETHTGGGMFFYNSTDLTKGVSELAIPLVGKLRFKTGNKFSIGLRLSYIFNSFNNLYSAGLSLQWTG
ncbi:hypothetical protein U0L90_10090 [Flavobacteriaceae sp. LMIT009]